MIKEILDTGSITEAKINKDSYMFNGRPSSEIIANSGRYGNPDRGDFSIWVNGGSAYAFEFNPVAANTINDLDWKEKDKLASEIAVKVAKLVEKEVQKLEKKFS